MIFKESDKFYFGKDVFKRDMKKDLSLGVIGLLEKYSTLMAYDDLKYPWITMSDIEKWCKDDVTHIEYYIKEGLDKNCLIQLNEEQAMRLQNDPLNNCWLYE